MIGALTAEVNGGEYFDDGRLVDPSAEAQRDDLRDDLMAVAFDALGAFLPRA